jgi:phosphoglycerate kinase
VKTIDDLGDLRGKRVLLRSDLNVPLDAPEHPDGPRVITDDGRIRASIPTIKRLRDAGARVIIAAHLGRPEGVPDLEYSLVPVAARLGEILAADVGLVGLDDTAKIDELGEGGVVLLENIRFHPGETSKDDAERRAFAERLAHLADVFVSDGFGVVHRKQASVYDVAEILPSAVGDLVRAEVEVLERLTERPERPYAVVLGGSKVSDKLGVIDNLLEKADTLLIGGGMVFTFLGAQGHGVGKPLLEEDQLDVARGYIERAAASGVELILPTDIVVAPEFAADAPATTVSAGAIPDDQMGLDIGPESAAHFASIISASKTVFWNGPMGVFEFPAFAAGTRAVAEALTKVDGLSVVGGGDSAAAVRTLGFDDDQFDHISTGGGASLEYLEGKTLPGLEVIG